MRHSHVRLRQGRRYAQKIFHLQSQERYEIINDHYRYYRNSLPFRPDSITTGIPAVPGIKKEKKIGP